MLWVILAVCLILAIVFGLHRSKPAPQSRNAPLEDSLPDYLQTLAARPSGRTPVRLSCFPQLKRKLNQSLFFLHQIPREELLPASQWFFDHGRMLQEEAAALHRALTKAPPLPTFADGETRIGCFARVFFAHNNAELTTERLQLSVEAWQRQSPFTVRELEAFQPALKNALMSLLCSLAQQCADEQTIQTAADETVACLEKQQNKQAVKLFERHRHHRLYLSRLNARVRKAPEGDAALWMHQLPLVFSESDEHLTEEERVHQSEAVQWVRNAIASLERLQLLPWAQLTEEWSHCHRFFIQDAIYPSMDAQSRFHYRLRTGEIARLGMRTERAVCETLQSLSGGYPPEDLRSHIGYFLLDEGLPILLQALRLKPSFRIRFRFGVALVKAWRIFFFSLPPVILAALLLTGVPLVLGVPCAILLSYTIVKAVKMIVASRVLPRQIPRIALEQLPQDACTLVVCPAVLLSPAHALKTVRTLSIWQKANNDPNLHFLLLGDFRDSMAGSLADDEEIIHTAAAAIRALKTETGHPFLYLHRDRVYHLPDHVHMSRERRHGSLETLMKLTEGQPVNDTFAYASIQPEKLSGQYRYLITLDADATLTPGSALRLVGAMLHPLQKRCVLGDHLRGVSIVQPKWKVDISSAQTPLSLLFKDEDPFHSQWADRDYRINRQCAFRGAGIIDPRAMLRATEGQMVPGGILDGDALEGFLGGCAYAEDIVLYHRQPETLTQWLTQLGRNTRSHWQLLPYVLDFLPKGIQPERNTLLKPDRHSIQRNAAEGIIPFLQLTALILCVVFRKPVLMLLCLLALAIPTPESQRWNALPFLFRLGRLPAIAAVQTDAIVRTMYRLFFSRKKLMDVSEPKLLPSPINTDMRFFYGNMGAAGILALLCILPGALRLPGVVLAAFWTAVPFVLPILEKERHPAFQPTGYMREVLMRLAKSTLLFFETAITPEDHGLPPDNVQIDPNKGIAHRTSPASIGLYLCGLISAQRLELITADELAQRIRPAVEAMEQMQKWHGHQYQWYDTHTLEPLKPRYVSTTDNGILAVCITTAAQGIRCLLHQLPEYDYDLPERLDALADSMQFASLFDQEAGLFYDGYDAENETLTDAHSNLLASENRLTSFYAIMTGQVPVHHWKRVGRTRVHTRYGQTLLSRHGGLVEYLIPFLFQPPINGTLLTETARNAIQQHFACPRNGISGASESGYYAFDPYLHYQSKAFGLPQLALNAQVESSVIAPYATLLALALEPKAAFSNLLRMESLGLEGPLGLFEAADFDPLRIGEGQPMRLIHSHRAHHQGMILCAICNFLCNQALGMLFSHLPKAQAFRLLLEEPMTQLSGVLTKPLSRPQTGKQPPSMFAANPAASLRFPVHAHVLHGGNTTLLVDALGGGYLRCNGIMATRFHPSCHQPSGLRLFIKDSQSGQYWQATDPAAKAVFETAQAVFQLSVHDISSTLRIFVDPLSGMAVHALTIENSTQTQRMLEICSYLEPELTQQLPSEYSSPHREPCMETAKLGTYGVSILRRAEDPSKASVTLWHTLCADTPFSVFHTQTDRCAFLGRGRNLHAPRELELPLSSLADAIGATIDPCLSLRGQFVLQAGDSARFVFVTGCPKSAENPSAFLLRCDQPDSVLGWYDAALTQALVTAQTLDLSPDEQRLLEPVAGLLTYTGQPSQCRYANGNKLPLQALEPLGLSGSIPIVTLECHNHASIAEAVLLLKIHAFCHMSGLEFDLVLFDHEDADAHVLHGLQDAVNRSHSRDLLQQPGGIHLLKPSQQTPENLQLLMAAARLALRTAEGNVSEQLAALDSPAQSRYVYRQKGAQAWKLSLPETGELLCSNGYGGFTQEEGNYVITLPPGRQTPAPWCNPLCNEHFGTVAGESGLLFTCSGQGKELLTRLWDSSVNPVGDETFFLRDESHRLLWSLTRQPLGMGMAVRITHAPGVTTYEGSGYGILSKMHCFTDQHSPMGIRVIQLKNEDTVDRILTFCHSLILNCGSIPAAAQLCHVSRLGSGLCLENPQINGLVGLCAIDPEASIHTTLSAGAFQGLWGMAPAALSGAELPPSGGGNAAMLCLTVQLKPGESKTITCAIAHARKRSELAKAFQRLKLSGASKRLHQVKQGWEHRLSALLYDLPDQSLSLLLNRWLPYQVRTAWLMRHDTCSHQAACSTKDALPDVLALLHTEPEAVRQQLLLCACAALEEENACGQQSSDEASASSPINSPLLLPYMTALYVQTTNDHSLLEEPLLPQHTIAPVHKENSRSATSRTRISLREYCLRMLARIEQGEHGLPVISGNAHHTVWADANNESVCLGMFLCEVLRLFAPLCPADTRKSLLEQRNCLLSLLDQHGWDGNWYLNSWNGKGTTVGSKDSACHRINAASQSWAVLCGVSRDRCQSAMENVWRMLYQKDIGILQLFAPPYGDTATPIARYLPGTHLNGGQLTATVPWAISALHQLGQDPRAWQLALAVLPVRHAATQQLARRYLAEPYAMAGTVFGNPRHRGRGGMAWDAGSASWYLNVLTEQLLGFQKTGDLLRFRPVLPEPWNEVHLRYRYGSTTYHLHASREYLTAVADGQSLTNGILRLVDDGRIHEASFPVRACEGQ